MPLPCHSRHTITSDVWVFIYHDNRAEDRAWHIFDRLGSKIGLYVLFSCHSQLYVTNIYKSQCCFFLRNPNCFAELIMVFYHASADIQRTLIDPLGVTGCTKPNGQSTGWKLNLFPTGYDGDKCISPVVVIVVYKLQRLTYLVGLIMGDQPKLCIEKTCNYSWKSSL